MTQQRDDWHHAAIGKGVGVDDHRRGSKLTPSPDLETSGAFNNAYELMAYAVNTAETNKNNVIFQKYFDMDDKYLVMDIFHHILGHGVHGAPNMMNITVTAGAVNEENPAPAELIHWDTSEPRLLISDDAFVYPDYDEIKDPCQIWDDEGMGLDMYMLGSILLHVYT
jgi:hypothetical protein